MNDPGRPRYNIYFFEPWLGLAPAVLSLADRLQKGGNTVTVYIRRSEMGAAGKIENSVRVSYLTNLSRVPVIGAIARALRSSGLGFLVLPVEILVYFSGVFTRELFRWRGARYHIEIDFVGAPVASFFSKLRAERLTYLSLELSQPRKFRLAGRVLQSLERWALRSSELLVIQDKDRADALSNFLNHAHPNIFFLPNASGISGSEVHRFLLCRENYFRDKFRISRSRYPHLLLHAGIIYEAACCLELARGFDREDQPFALIMHSAARKSVMPEYVENIASLRHGNLFLSRDPVPFDELGRIYAAADIGLCFYRKIDSNHGLISRASGKLACFLQFRKPVLMADLPSLVELNDQYQFGVVIKNVNDSEELYRGAEDIVSNYDRLQENAGRCYQEVFDNERRLQELVGKFDAQQA
jgi:hypothetical protein